MAKTKSLAICLALLIAGCGPMTDNQPNKLVSEYVGMDSEGTSHYILEFDYGDTHFTVLKGYGVIRETPINK